MAIPIQMPQPGNTVEECILVRWLHNKGERITAGEIIAEIETDKANFEIEAPGDGTLLATFFDEGALVPVLTNVGVIGEAGEDVEPFRPKRGAAPERPAAALPLPTAPARQAEPADPAPPAPIGVMSPRARRFAEEHGFTAANIAGSGPGGRILEADLLDRYQRAPRVSPLAQEMIEMGFRARDDGSGANRMVRAEDLLEPPVKMSGIRGTIARRMRESLTTTAQYTMHTSADATGLLAIRASLKAKGGAWSIVNVNDLVMYCAIHTLKEFPDLNAELIGGEIFRHSRIHIAFACDTPRGLVVPVVKNSHDLSLLELATRVHDLGDQAVKGTLSPDDMAGATFTVSNLGSLGIEEFTPIVNPPQVAILGVNAIRLKPVRRNGDVEFIDYIGYSLTCDHQVVDGAPGARFLQALRTTTENVREIAGIETKEH